MVPGGHARIGSGEDGSACVDGAYDPRLGDAQRLLLHHLVQDGAGAVRHLVELVDAADSVVTESQRPRLQHQLSGLGVLRDVGGQPHSGGPLPGGVLAPGGESVHVLQQLGLRRARVSAQEDINVCSELSSPRLLKHLILLAASE